MYSTHPPVGRRKVDPTLGNFQIFFDEIIQETLYFIQDGLIKGEEAPQITQLRYKTSFKYSYSTRKRKSKSFPEGYKTNDFFFRFTGDFT